MTLRNGFPAVSDAADQFDIRAALRANIAQDADGNIKQGLAPTAATLSGVVTSRDDMQCDIAAFSAAIDRQGPVFLHHEGTDQVTITPAPAANSRIDSIWVKQQESAAPLSDSTDGPIFGVTDGTPNANPVPPEIPEGALQLATITIPSTATSTSSSGVIITNTYPFTASLGGQIYFRSDTEMQEWTPVEGQKAFIPTGDKAGEYVGKSEVWDSVSLTPPVAIGKFAHCWSRSGVTTVTYTEGYGTPIIHTTSGQLTRVATLPKGFCPPHQVVTPFAQNPSSGALGKLIIKTDGTINLTHSYGNSGENWLNADVTITYACG
jgi:hypothetical protein